MRVSSPSPRMKLVLGSLALVLLAPLAAVAQVGVVNGLTQEKVVKAGETYQGVIVLKNNGPQEEEVRLYLNDYLFNSQGQSFYEAPGKVARSNAAWITLGRKQMTIAGLASAEVRYTVTVPKEGALVGTFWSIVMIEAVPKIKAGAGPAGNKISFGFSQVMRYGVQIVDHLGTSGTSKLRFLQTDLLEEDGKRTLRADVENVGERWLRPYSSLEIYNEKGELAAKIEGDRWRLYPGTSARFNFDVTKLSSGKYRVLVILDNKDANVFGAQYTLLFSGPGRSTPATKFETNQATKSSVIK